MLHGGPVAHSHRCYTQRMITCDYTSAVSAVSALLICDQSAMLQVTSLF